MPKSNFCQPKTDERLDFLREAVDGGMSRNNIKTTGAGVIAPIVATAAAIFAFWWLGKYSLLNERDIVGTAITVWCAVLIRVLMWAE